MNKKELAIKLIELVGGENNINSVQHCMTRLRFVLKEESEANLDAIKAAEGVKGAVFQAGQLQIIIGPSVGNLYDEVIKVIPGEGEVSTPEKEKKDKNFKYYAGAVMDGLSGCVVQVIPVLLVCGLCKAFVAVLGPQLLNLFAEDSNFVTVFTMVGDAGFYFLPVIVGYSAAKKFNVTPVLGILMGAVLIHPTMVSLSAEGASLSIFGIPFTAQNYTTSILPIILTVWVMSYVERFFKKYIPDTLKVIGVPLCTVLVMLPLELCVFGPAGSFVGNGVAVVFSALFNFCGPLAVAVVAGLFAILVMTGMHAAMGVIVFQLYTTYGFDALFIPSMFAANFVLVGVGLACMIKFKNKDNRQLTLGYIITFLFGGVSEPMLYGLSIPYKTPLYASMLSAGITGLVAGLLGLKAYVLSMQSGIFAFTAFLGGERSNYVALVVTTIVAVVAGFICMWFMPLKESVE